MDERIQATLFTRAGCHLCEDAERVLLRNGIVPTKVDVDTDPALRDRYGLCVPVVEIDGRERFRGVVDERLLVRLLAARRP